MPLVIKLKPGPYKLSDVWGDEDAELIPTEEWIDILYEDTQKLMDDLGGLGNIIESVEWVEE